ncbi:MAG: hypothetical protein JO063_01905 [Pseudonocardiales bacterium]|nr:hypothetical protein [Pseudonocardiales bacterium]
MINSDRAGQGKEPELPPDSASAEPPAGHGRSKTFTSAFFGYAVALIWAIVLLVVVAVKTSVASPVVATLGGAVTAVTAVIGVFQLPKLPTIDRKVIKGVVAVILMVDFGVSVGWAGWSYYGANRPVDVLSTVILGQNIDVLPGGHAMLDVAVSAQRNTFELVFQVADHNGEIGVCVPNTSLSVTPDTAGNHGGTVPAGSGTVTSVPVPAGTAKLHVDIAVTNTRGDQNCAVDLSVVSAKLQNK